MTSPGGNVVEIRVRTVDQTGAGFATATTAAKRFAAAVDTGPGSVTGALSSAHHQSTALGSTLGRVGTIAGGILAADVFRAAAQRIVSMAQQTIHAASSLGESLNA